MDGPLMLVHFYPERTLQSQSKRVLRHVAWLMPCPQGLQGKLGLYTGVPAPHGYGLMMTQINQNQHLLNRSPGAATHIWIEKWLLCWCGQLKKDSVPYLVFWKGKKKKRSEGKDHRKTSKHAERPHPVVIPQRPRSSPRSGSRHTLPVCLPEARMWLLWC